MSQVKNLRAMFENKDDGGSPDRGRTPAPNGSDSPRPLSKVRTSFVAIEKDGRMGLRRDHSGESSVSRRRLSNDTDAESTSAMPDETIKPARKLFTSEPIPESPRLPPDGKNESTPTGTVEEKKPVEEEVTGEAAPGAKEKVSPPKATPPAQPNDANSASKPGKDAAPASNTKELASRTAPARPSTISTKSTTKPPAKSPSLPKTPTAAAHRLQSKPTAKPSDKVPAKKDAPVAAKTASRAATTASKPTASSIEKRPHPIKPPTAQATGFVKPKPKSPTKPVNLPSSLMAPTASSVSRGGAARQPPARQSLSRQSGHLQPPSTNNRPSSRASTSALPTQPKAQPKTIRRQASSINRPRPSIGPPPKKADAGASKPPAEVDESFLARMMRPTQASASKTTEKVPLTPPRKTTQRPSTAASSRRESSVKGSTANGSPAAKPIITISGNDETASAKHPSQSIDQSIDAGEDNAVKNIPVPQPQIASPSEVAHIARTGEASNIAEETPASKTVEPSSAKSLETPSTPANNAPEETAEITAEGSSADPVGAAIKAEDATSMVITTNDTVEEHSPVKAAPAEVKEVEEPEPAITEEKKEDNIEEKAEKPDEEHVESKSEKTTPDNSQSASKTEVERVDDTVETQEVEQSEQKSE